ncbi:MAG: alpha/beta hydrolase [Dehalococcoidia bacterium]|nr:MAG: alpha/beta hydrolase [Dehalococcoidia bacterium]
MKTVLNKVVVIILVLGVLATTGCWPQPIFVSSNAAPFLSYKLGVVLRDVTYRTMDDASLKMDIYYSPGAKRPMPVIVYVHGGGWYSGDKTTGAGQHDIPELVGRGYLVAAVNYRLAPRYQFPAQIEDIKYAIHFLRSSAATYNIDPDNIGAFGESAGGHLVSLLGLTDRRDADEFSYDCQNSPPHLKAVVDLYGPTDLTETFEIDQSDRIEHVFGTSDPESQIIKEASPLTHVSRRAPPFLIIHGDKDDIVLVNQSHELYDQLISAGASATFVVVKNCGHAFTPVDGDIIPTRKEISSIIADFLDQYLKDGA